MMQRLETSAIAPFPALPRGLTAVLAYGGVLFCLMVWLARLLLAPDPTGDLFAKAQHLETRGQIDLALRGYRLLTERHPESPYAPQALQKQGDILSSMGRRGGDKSLLRQALAVYEHLANNYPNTPLAGPAFLQAGTMAYDRAQLGDFDQAARIYSTMLARYPNDAVYASQASVKLGRIALERGQNEDARKRFVEVLRAYPRLSEPCSEALYHLGWLSERANNRDGARDIYRATLKRYPGSKWASDARERLGMLSLNEAERPRERRVLLEVAPLPDESDAPEDDGLLSALRPLLAARGLPTSASTLGGWGLTPFYAGFNPSNPLQVPRAPFDSTRNIIANAGLMMTARPAGLEPIRALQDELDMAHAPMVFNGKWNLSVGYDSSRLQVFLQRSGATFDIVPVKDFVRDWAKPSPGGKPYTMLTFWAKGDKALRAPDKKTVASSATPAKTVVAPTPTPFAALLTTPTWHFQLPPLSERAAHQRTLAHAVQWLRRPRDGQTLLNGAALQALERELRFLSRAPVEIEPGLPPAKVSPVPTPETGNQDAGTESVDEAAELPQRAQAAPTQPAVSSRSRLASMRNLNRTRALLGWFGAPLDAYLNARRDAQSYLDVAGDALKNPALHRAAQQFEAEVAALERARDALPAADALSQDGRTLDAPTQRALNEVAREIGLARQAEARAVALMSAK